MKIILIVFISCLLFSCSTSEKKSPEKFNIVTTTGIIADGVKNIVGDKATVTALMGPGVDPHLYQPLHHDYDLLNNADLIIYNGLHLEGKMAGIFEKMARKRPVIAVSNYVNQDLLLQSEDFETFDPHIWFNVNLWSSGLEGVCKELCERDSLNKATYNANWKAYKKQLTDLHSNTRSALQAIPKEQRLLITAHDAFNYYGKAYNIEVKGLQGISTLAQAGIKDVTSLVDLIISRNIKAIFVESSVPKKQIEVVVENCAAKNHALKIGGTLYSDALGAKDSEAGTYLGMVKLNTTTISQALK